jgi:hypothetical protein
LSHYSSSSIIATRGGGAAAVVVEVAAAAATLGAAIWAVELTSVMVFIIALLEAATITDRAEVLTVAHMSTIAFPVLVPVAVPTGLAAVVPIGREMAGLTGLMVAAMDGRATAAATTVQS